MMFPLFAFVACCVPVRYCVFTVCMCFVSVCLSESVSGSGSVSVSVSVSMSVSVWCCVYMYFCAHEYSADSVVISEWARSSFMAART